MLRLLQFRVISLLLTYLYLYIFTNKKKISLTLTSFPSHKVFSFNDYFQFSDLFIYLLCSWKKKNFVFEFELRFYKSQESKLKTQTIFVVRLKKKEKNFQCKSSGRWISYFAFFSPITSTTFFLVHFSYIFTDMLMKMLREGKKFIHRDYCKMLILFPLCLPFPTVTTPREYVSAGEQWSYYVFFFFFKIYCRNLTWWQGFRFSVFNFHFLLLHNYELQIIVLIILK